MASDQSQSADDTPLPLDPTKADDEAVRRLAEEQAAAGEVKPTPGA